VPFKSIEEMEKRVPAMKDLPGKAKGILFAAFNSAYESSQDDKTAIRIAWAAVKKVYEKRDGQWYKKRRHFSAEYPNLVQKLPEKARQIWINVYWNEKERHEVAGVKVPEAIESSANMNAWTAVKQTWRKNEHGVWVEKYNAKHKIEPGPVDHGDYWSCGRLPIINKGIHNGEPYSIDELRVLASNALASTPMGIGHGINWTLSLEGLAHAGLIERMYMDGDTLFADVNYIPAPIGVLLFKKVKYPHRSIVEGQIVEIDDTNRITRVDWLGVESPAVKNLPALQELFDLKAKKNKTKNKTGGKSMDDRITPQAPGEELEEIQELAEDENPAEEETPDEASLEKRVAVLEEKVAKLEEGKAEEKEKPEEGATEPVPLAEKKADAEVGKEAKELAEETISEMNLPKEALKELKTLSIKARLKAARVIKHALKNAAPKAPLGKIKLSAKKSTSEFERQLAEAKSMQANEEV